MYRVRTTEPFKCAYLPMREEGRELVKAGVGFAKALQEAGYELTGECRMVIPEETGSGGDLAFELQLGIQ